MCICDCVCIHTGVCGFFIHCRGTINNQIVKAGPCHPRLQAPSQSAEKRMWVFRGTCRGKASRQCPSFCFNPVVHPHPLARFACDLTNSCFDGDNSYFSHVFQNCQGWNCVHVAFLLSPSSPSHIYGPKDLPQM